MSDTLCEYGCGQVANYPPEKGRKKYCCSITYRKCPGFIDNHRNKNTGKKRSAETIKNLSNGRKGIKNSAPIAVDNNEIICNFGCNQKALFYFPTSKKYCCLDNVSKCPKKRTEISERLKGHIVSDETKEKIRKKIININETNEEYRTKQSLSRKLKVIDYEKRYPFFSKIEEIRTNHEKKIEVKCKKCGVWFAPTQTQLYERIRQVEKDYGNGGCYFYCSQECKDICSLYNIHNDPYDKTIKDLPYTYEEYQTFRQHVLTRDSNICQFCGANATDVHHERPQKLEPFFALDPDFAWSCCEDCHYSKGHSGECNTGNLAKQQCKSNSREVN